MARLQSKERETPLGPHQTPGRSRVERTRNHVRVRLWVRERVWVWRALNLGAQVLSELWGTVRFRFRFRFRRFTSSGHWPPWAELFVVHQNQTIHTNIELSRQSSMKLYGSLAFDLCPAAEKGKNQNSMEVCELTTMQYPLLKYTEIKSKAYNSVSFNMNKVLKFVFFLTSNQSISFLDIVYFSLMCLTINVCLF